MPFIERDEFDTEYWAHAHAAVSEGFCPDCGQRLDRRVEKKYDFASERFYVVGCTSDLECIPCEVDWVSWPDHPAGWVRVFRRNGEHSRRLCGQNAREENATERGGLSGMADDIVVTLAELFNILIKGLPEGVDRFKLENQMLEIPRATFLELHGRFNVRKRLSPAQDRRVSELIGGMGEVPERLTLRQRNMFQISLSHARSAERGKPDGS